MNWGVEISDRAVRTRRELARSQSLTCYESLDVAPTILFPADSRTSRQGNFIDDSYRAALANRLGLSGWRRRTLNDTRCQKTADLTPGNSTPAIARMRSS